MNRQGIIFLFFSLILIKNGHAQLADQLSLIKTASSQQVVNFLQKVPNGQEPLYGFKDRSEINNAKVGEPYAVYTISGDSVQQISQYRVPVLVGVDFKGLLTVVNTAQGWKVVDFGANGLAKEIQEFEKQNKCNGNACKRVILRVNDVKCDFISIDDSSTKVKNHRFFPMNSAKSRMSSHNKRMAAGAYFNLSEVIQFVKEK